MKHKIIASAIILILTSIPAFANGNLAELAKAAISLDSEIANAAIKELRERGQKGSDILLKMYKKEIQIARKSEIPVNWNRIKNALDNVTMQRDSHASLGIFWYTDFEKARELSRKTRRPILSLRLLGNLNEELSCANSRLFRALLYPENNSILREQFVLHWKSVRPAPKVTIDYGDGRKIVRTLTGNSIHYVLDSEGKVIDALPGLYSSGEFRKFLAQGKLVFDNAKKIKKDKRSNYYKRYQESSLAELIAKRERSLRIANLEFEEVDDRPFSDTPRPDSDSARENQPVPVVRAALNVARTKSNLTMERILVNQITDTFAKFEPSLDMDDWKTLANLRVGKVHIPKVSRRFIWNQLKNSGVEMSTHESRIKKLEEFIALDTVRNEYLYRPAIYEIISKNNTLSTDEINEIIYSSVFLTPGNDPWLGLNAPDIYTGLEANGIVR